MFNSVASFQPLDLLMNDQQLLPLRVAFPQFFQDLPGKTGDSYEGDFHVMGDTRNGLAYCRQVLYLWVQRRSLFSRSLRIPNISARTFRKIISMKVLYFFG